MITVGGLLISGGIELAESREMGLLFQSITKAEAFPAKGLTAVAVALLLGVCTLRLGHMRGLPLAVLSAVAAFYLLSPLSGISLDTLAAEQWLMPVADSVSNQSGWTIMRRSSIDWGTIASQWSAFVSIAMISALALLLAVTALELSTRQSVDVDRELRAAGIANLGAGALGGSTGYHEDAVTAMLHQNSPGDKAKSCPT